MIRQIYTYILLNHFYLIIVFDVKMFFYLINPFYNIKKFQTVRQPTHVLHVLFCYKDIYYVIKNFLF